MVAWSKERSFKNAPNRLNFQSYACIIFSLALAVTAVVAWISTRDVASQNQLQRVANVCNLQDFSKKNVFEGPAVVSAQASEAKKKIAGLIEKIGAIQTNIKNTLQGIQKFIKEEAGLDKSINRIKDEMISSQREKIAAMQNSIQSLSKTLGHYQTQPSSFSRNSNY